MEGDQLIRIADPILETVGRLGDREGVDVYVVGGFVRDLLLGLDVKDMDLVVSGDGIGFARSVARELGAGSVVTFEKFGTAMIPLENRKLEFVGARLESYQPESRKPRVMGGSIDEDLARRDFTVNAIAVCLNSDRFGQLRDPFNGRGDLEQKILRTPREPEKTFDDDPLRILRAVRFASQLGFTIEERSMGALASMRQRLSIVSQERITEELLKILRTMEPSVGLRLLFDTGVMEIVFPEIARLAGIDQRRDHHHKDVFLHTCIVVDSVAKQSDKLWLRFAALVHDIAKPRTKAYKEGTGWTFHGHEELGARMMKGLFRKMRLPMDALPYVEKLVRLHLRPMVLVDSIVTDSAVRRLVFDTGDAIDDLMMLCRADITSKNPTLVKKYLRNYEIVLQKIKQVEEKDRLRNWQPPLKGDEIMSVCGLSPGRKVGDLKKAIEEAILEGEIPNEHDAALNYLLKIKDEILKS